MKIFTILLLLFGCVPVILINYGVNPFLVLLIAVSLAVWISATNRLDNLLTAAAYCVVLIFGLTTSLIVGKPELSYYTLALVFCQLIVVSIPKVLLSFSPFDKHG